jgi:hypothetical protein
LDVKTAEAGTSGAAAAAGGGTLCFFIFLI